MCRSFVYLLYYSLSHIEVFFWTFLYVFASFRNEDKQGGISKGIW